MDDDIPFVLEFCETAQFRLAEFPGIRARAKLLAEALRANPAQHGRAVADGMLRYKPYKSYLWCYILTRDATTVRCTVLTIDLLSDPDLKTRLRRTVWAGLQELNLLAKVTGAMADEWKKGA